MHLPRAWVVLLAATGGHLVFAQSTPEESIAKQRLLVSSDQVAQVPYPGTELPVSLRFTPDGKSVRYLLPENPQSTSRVAWRIDLDVPGPARVVARAPGEGESDATVSQEEALRRERQRQRGTGLVQEAWAESEEVAVYSIGGDLFLQVGEGPLDRLTATPSPEIDPQIEPSGKLLAFVREGELFVMDLATKKETALTQGAQTGLSHGLAEYIAQEELDRRHGFWWSPDGSRLAFQQNDERAIPPFTITSVGGEAYGVETHRYPFAGASNCRVRLGVVSVKGGPTQWLEYAPKDEESYLARVLWEDANHLLVQSLSRDQKRLCLVRLDIQGKNREVLVEVRSPHWVDLHDDLRLLPETGEFLWCSEFLGARRIELRNKSGKLIRRLTPESCPVDRVLAVDAKRQEVWYQGRGQGPLETHIYRASLSGGQPERLTKDIGTHEAVVSPCGDNFIHTYSNLSTPPRVVVRDRSGKEVRALHDAASDPRLSRLLLSPPELMRFENREGTTLYGAYYAPLTPAADDSAARVPLVVLTYGGPTVQTVRDNWSMTADMLTQYLRERGFAVWKCDNRGSSGREAPFRYSIHKRLGVLEVADQADGVRYILSQRKELDPSRVGITGASYGGYMTLRSMLLEPEVFKAGVAISPVTFWEGYDTAYTERYMGLPRENAEAYRQSSVLESLDRLKGRLLLIHGMIDENVHFRHTARLIDALISAGRPFEVLPLPSERHGTRKYEGRKFVAERIANFFKTSL